MIEGKTYDDEIEGFVFNGTYEGVRIEATFVSCDFTGSAFSDCNLATSRFVDCTFDGVQFAGCDLHKTWFIRGSLIGAEITDSNLQKCEMTNTRADELSITASNCNHARLQLSGSGWQVHASSADGLAVTSSATDDGTAGTS